MIQAETIIINDVEFLDLVRWINSEMLFLKHILKVYLKKVIVGNHTRGLR